MTVCNLFINSFLWCIFSSLSGKRKIEENEKAQSTIKKVKKSRKKVHKK